MGGKGVLTGEAREPKGSRRDGSGPVLRIVVAPDSGQREPGSSSHSLAELQRWRLRL